MSTIPKQSAFAQVFDETNVNWHQNATYNRTFLQCQQAYANDKLQARGHVFLNEVYDMLGMKRTTEGQLVGWTKDGAHGDHYIDFSIDRWDAAMHQICTSSHRCSD